MRRLSFALTVAALLAIPAPALADPPGPTSFQNEVVAVEPDTPGITVEIVGGDSFVQLTAEAGVAVEVSGYNGEAYLRFLADGTVEENQRASSKYLNEDRYGQTSFPAGVDADAMPEWEVVADQGSYAWHDHRTHWMNPVAPPGRGPGDRVAEGVVPLLVNGVAVDVTVVSVWQPAPSRLPVIAGGAAGLFFGLVAWRWRLWSGVIVLLLSAAAVAVGGAAYQSVPAETQPPWSLYVFPLVSFILALAVAYPDWLGPLGRLVRGYRTTLLLLAVLELVAWGILHWSWLWLAVLPTSLPFWLDRLVSASVLAGGAAIAVALLANARQLTPASGASS